MHEWALAEAVVATLQRLRRDQGGKAILSVILALGELQAVDAEVLRQGLEACGEGDPIPADRFHFETEKASFRCNACGAEWDLADASGLGEVEREAIHFLPELAHTYLRCPACQGPDFLMVKGRGVTIASVEFADT